MQEQIAAVQRMQDYIEAHLGEEITPAALAGAACYSPWYSYRLFTRWTHRTPADYIRRLRLSRSALQLRDDRCRVAEVAFAMGFGSVDGYQRAFFREFGCNPREYAVSPVPLCLFTPYGVRYQNAWKERINMETVKSIFMQRLEKPARKAIIKRGKAATEYGSYCQEVGCDIWGILTSMKCMGNEPVCLWLPESLRTPGTSQYVQGVEEPPDYDGPVPEGFDVIALPAASYLMFQGEPFAEDDYCEAIQTLQAAIARYNPAAIGCRWDPASPRVQLEPVGERGYIELLSVRPL